MENINYGFHFDNCMETNPIQAQYFTLYQVGDLFLSHEEEVPEHTQYCFEITFVERGNGIIKVNDETYTVKQNDLQFSFLNETHKLQAETDSHFRFFYLGLNPVPNSICETIVATIKDYCAKNGRVLSYPKIFDAMKDTLMEFYNKSVFFIEKIESCILNMLIALYRKITGATAERQIENPNYKSEIVYNILNYINSSPNKLITLKDISENFFYDYNYISRTFKEIMNVSLHDYLYDLRLEAAKNLLLSSEKSVAEISESFGYSSIHSFSRSFKKKFGLSPQSYKIEHASNMSHKNLK